MAQTIKAKKTCCRSSPRCKNCPVVLARLEQRGLVKRRSKRRWKLVKGKIKKSVMAAARRY